jgi:EAL domain-containing protein (putative c-di-GMP-specific phosphodiesterase class I)
MVVAYACAWYMVYTAMRTPQAALDAPKTTTIKPATLRLQERIAALYLTNDQLAGVFTTLDTLAREHGVAVTVEGVTNPQPAVRGTASPATVVDVRATFRGPLAQTVAAVRDVAVQPVLSRILDFEITEDADAQAPLVKTTIRYFVRAN